MIAQMTRKTSGTKNGRCHDTTGSICATQNRLIFSSDIAVIKPLLVTVLLSQLTLCANPPGLDSFVSSQKRGTLALAELVQVIVKN